MVVDDDLQRRLLHALAGGRFMQIMNLALNRCLSIPQAPALRDPPVVSLHRYALRSEQEDVREETRTFTELEREMFEAGSQSRCGSKSCGCCLCPLNMHPCCFQGTTPLGL